MVKQQDQLPNNGTDWESLSYKERKEKTMDLRKVLMNENALKKALKARLERLEASLQNANSADNAADLQRSLDRTRALLDASNTDHFKLTREEEIELIGSSAVFHAGELALQYESQTLAFAKMIGEPKIHTTVPPGYFDFIQNRLIAYIATMDEETMDVWLSVVFATPTPGVAQQAINYSSQDDRPHLYTSDVTQENIDAKLLVEQRHAAEPFCAPWDHCNVSTAASNLVPSYQSSMFLPLLQIEENGAIVRLTKPPPRGDPLWTTAAKPGKWISINLIEHTTRKRFRVNGVVASPVSSDGLSMYVREAFPICPKYIQRRAVTGLHGPHDINVFERSPPDDPSLTDHMINLITSSDTMFIATVHPKHGADAGHRGGRCGFVRVAGRQQIIWPDYEGKGMFQTLGNLAGNPCTGLTFVEYMSGEVLQITGKLDLILLQNGEAPDGASKLCVLQIAKWVFRRNGCPFKAPLIQFSSFNPLLQDTAILKFFGPQVRSAAMDNNELRQKNDEPIIKVKIVSITEQAENVKSIVLSTGNRYVAASPGQYAVFTMYHQSLPIWRAWTCSSATVPFIPEKFNVDRSDCKTNTIEITMKTQNDGIASKWFNESAKVGDEVILMGIEGQFTLDASEKILYHPKLHPRLLERTPPSSEEDMTAKEWWKVLMISGGIGCTPFISQLRGLDNIRRLGKANQSDLPDIVLFHSERHAKNIAFKEDLHNFAENGLVRIAFALTEDKEDDKESQEIVRQIHQGADFFHHAINAQALMQVVPDIRDRVVYMCGPDGFMTALTQAVTTLGVNPRHILSESFQF